MALLSHEKLEVLFNSKNSEMAKYQLEIEIPGRLSKDKRRESIQTMKKHANFKGFRKGTIPPFIMKDIPDFVLKDCCEELIKEAVHELDLSPVEGEASEPQYDFDDMKKRFEVGETFVFTCDVSLNKIFEDGSDDVPEEVVAIDTTGSEFEGLPIESAQAFGKDAE